MKSSVHWPRMKAAMRPFFTHAILLSIAMVLPGCGGGTKLNNAENRQLTVEVDHSGARGALIENPPTRIGTLKTTHFTEQLQAAMPSLLAIAGTPKCDVDFHHFEYSTVGAATEQTTASGGLMVPTGTDPICRGPRPVLLYGHGSSLLRNVNMADISGANSRAGNAIQTAALYAAQGYIVVAPNYAGYDTSTLSYHPHHIADQQSKDMIDALKAARKAFPNLSNPAFENGKLFITGYSEGGYVSMATHRAMQAAGMTVTASVPQSGSYAESVSYESLGLPGALNRLGAISLESRLQMAMQLTAWQKAYGNIYDSPTDVYAVADAKAIETLLPSTRPLDSLIGSGKFPKFLLGTDMPGYSSLSNQDSVNYGPPAQSLLATPFVTRLANDIATHPCPVTSATAPLDCVTTNSTRAAWLKNDLRTWAPAAPMLMCGGKADTEVVFLNAQLTQAYFQEHGSSVSLLDVDSAIGPNDPFAGAKSVFASTRKSVVAAGGDPLSAKNYHGNMVFAACAVAARDFFNQF